MEPPVPDSSDTTRTATAGAQPTLAFGSYRLLQKIGEGGMGEVWLAEQTRPVHRQVALKIIKAGMDTTQVIARFEAERQALALMDHPAIATVFDGGSTPEGRPYFAMEYVKGEPITTYCDRHRLGTRERLALFTLVCEGVQHAHQKGVIHRDLKPSNVLVTLQNDTPVPKIIDFGVAKATTQHLTERTVFTELGVLIGTPEYMSPEQADLTGLDIDTRTDVYALGVLLYELLTGALPFDRRMLRQKGLDEIRRTIREVDPPRPSTRITQMGPDSTQAAKNRHTEPSRLAGQLRGDLDWITMKALEKDRTRRYDTVMGLANDVRRHLRNEPVVAGPPSTTYRLGKFVRRHRAGVAAVALVIVALVAGVVLATYGLVRARRAEREALHQAAKATAINEFLQRTLFSAQPHLGQGREMKVVDALAAAVPMIEASFRDQPEIRAGVQHTIGRTYADLGLFAEAEPLLQRSLATRRELLGPDHPDVAESLHGLGTLAFQKYDFKAAEAYYRQALDIDRRARGEDSIEVSEILNDLAMTLEEGKADYAAAQPLLERSLAIKRARLGDHNVEVAQSMNNLGMLYYRKKDYAKAEALLRQALAVNHKVYGPANPEVAAGLNNLAVDLQRAGQLDEAEASLRESLGIYKQAFPQGNIQIQTTENILGGCLTDMKRYAEAEPLLTSSYAAILKQAGPNHPRTQAARNRVIQLYEAWGKPEKAAQYRMGSG